MAGKKAKKGKSAKKPAVQKPGKDAGKPEIGGLVAEAKSERAELERLNKWYSAKIEEKDSEISMLKKENSALLATALKQERKTKEIFDRAQQAMKKKK